MAIHYFVGSHTAGTELVNRIDISDNEPLTEAAAHGEVGRAGALIRDPTGTLDLDGWTPFYVTEDACSEPRLFTGWLVAREIRRGEGDFASVARTWDAQIVDLNHALTRRIIRDGKRPYETLAARVSWLLASEYVTGLVANGGLVDTAPTINYDESDYTDQRPIDVLQDVAPVAGKTFFTYWSTANARAELFLDQPADATFASTLRISNVAADVDDADPTTQVTFAPLADWVVRRSPEEQFTGVVYDWRGGRIYSQNETLVTDLGGQRLDGGFSTDRVGRLTTANAEVARWLAQHAGEFDTITLSVRIHKTRVNLIRQGHRIEVKLSNVPGYSSFTWSRIQRRTVRKTKSPDWFVLNLTMSLRTPAMRGGGGTGGLPAVQTVATHALWKTLDIEWSGGPLNAEPAGWRDAGFDDSAWDDGYLPPDPSGAWYDIPDAEFLSNQALRNGGHLQAGVWIARFEFTLAALPGEDVSLNWNSDNIADIWVNDNVVVATGPDKEWDTVGGLFATVSRGWFVVGANCIAVKIKQDPTNTTWALNPTMFQAIMRLPGASAPRTGQVVSGVRAAGTVNGTNQDFTAPFPFADGGLVVLHDGTDQSAHLASYNGATGAFRLTYGPSAGSKLRLQLVGR